MAAYRHEVAATVGYLTVGGATHKDQVDSSSLAEGAKATRFTICAHVRFEEVARLTNVERFPSLWQKWSAVASYFWWASGSESHDSGPLTLFRGGFPMSAL